jgi:hypothetical protein
MKTLCTIIHKSQFLPARNAVLRYVDARGRLWSQLVKTVHRAVQRRGRDL